MKFFLDITCNNLDFSQDLLEKDDELGPGKEHQSFGSHLLLVLLLLVQGSVFKEHGGKKNLIATSKVGHSKIIFALLVKI